MPDLLWTPPTGVALLRHRATERTVVLADGTKAKVTVDDSGTATQIETDDRLDAIVRPRTTVYRIRKG
jgi:hypothetical protein